MLNIEMRPTGDLTILDLSGRLHLGGPETLLTDKVNSLLFQGHRKILVNLAGVTSVDSRGFGALVSAQNSVMREGGHIALVHITRRIRSMLIISGLLTHFQSFDSEEQALASPWAIQEADGQHTVAGVA